MIILIITVAIAVVVIIVIDHNNNLSRILNVDTFTMSKYAITNRCSFKEISTKSFF